jgi:HEAT repeat protein
MKAKRLSKREFERALKLGLGRAFLHVRDYGDAGVEDVIERSLLTDYVYDNQFEGDRGWWCFSILLNTGRIHEYAEFLLNNIGRGELRPLDQRHQLIVAGYFFEQGYQEFRKEIFGLSRVLLARASHQVSCLRELISVAGEKGFEFGLVELCKGCADLDQFSWECNEIYEFANNNLSSVDEALKRIEELEPDTVRFRAAIEEFKREDVEPYKPKPDPTLSEIVEFITVRDSFVRNVRPVRFGKIATDEEIGTVFDLLQHADSEVKQYACLLVFDDRQLPLIDERILNILNADNKRLRLACASALSNCSDRLVRRKALTLLKSEDGEHINFGLALLKSNYRSSDANLVLKALQKLQTPQDIHSAGLALKDLRRVEGRQELKDCFLWLYENGPESWCRAQFVETLYEWQLCPDEILYESQWDSGSDSNEFARAILTSREIQQTG